jgi:hypothetical protein
MELNNTKNNLTMEQKLIILKNIKSLNLDKGEIMNYNNDSKSFILEVNTSDTDVSKQGVYTNSYSKRIEIGDEKAAQLIDNDLAELQIIYPKSNLLDREPEINTPAEFEDKLYNSSEQELKAILTKLEDLGKRVDELYNIYTY